MCLIVLSIKPNKSYKLVLSSNRDEFYDRPTENMHWWQTNPKVLAGKDKNFDGTWMAMTEFGKFAAVTNVKEFTSLSTRHKSLEELSSRGDLVKNFVMSDYTAGEYIDTFKGLNYQGFNLILFDGQEAIVCSNRGLEKKLDEGITYAIGNRPLEQKSEKLKSAEKDFKNILDSNISSKSLFKMMQLPKNEPLEFSKAFTKENHGEEFPYRFIETDIYGTRSTTTITIDQNNKAEILETTFGKNSQIKDANKFEINIL